MRTIYGSVSLLMVSAAFTFACNSGSGGSHLSGPTPIVNAEPTLDLSGSWQGTFSQSRDPRTPFGTVPPSHGTVRLSLIQSGTQVSGSGVANGMSGCMLNSFEVTGSVTGRSFRLSLTSPAGPGTVVNAYGFVSGEELDATFSSSSSGCQDWKGGSSLNRER
jgi:hypothetical protein